MQNPQPQQSGDVIIETRNVSRLYPGVTALDQVSYRVYRNKVNVLIGENGAGNVAGCVGRQERDGGGDFARIGKAPHGRAGEPGIEPFRL